MVSKNLILSKVQPFLNQQNVVIENQGVNDIITGILTTHNKYKKAQNTEPNSKLKTQ